MDKIQAIIEEITGKGINEEENLKGSKVRAFAWARVSTEEQERRGLSIPQQLKEIGEYAARRDIEIVEQFHEAASAFSKNGKRPEFDRMIEKAKANPDINAILIHDFSRFSRDSVTGRALLRELRDAGIRVLSVNDPDFDPETESGVYTEAFTFAKNEVYSRTLAMHVKKGCRANVNARDPESGLCFKNGAKPLWGYKAERVNNGVGKGGRPIQKTIWVLDDTVVAGKPVHEWVRYLLIDLVLHGFSVGKLRDFCNESGIPGRRAKPWGTNSFRGFFDAHNLLKYAGYGVWNVRSVRGVYKPASEWEIVENAHPPIITLDEALKITEVRRELRRDCPGFGKAGKSEYLLSGGLASCARCGGNLIGHKNQHAAYYVCASEPYRAGKGCGKGVYIPQLLLEGEVVKDIQGIIAKLADPVRFTKKVNEELRQMWKQQTGFTPDAEKRIREIDGKIDHIRNLLESGLDDVAWANGRIRDLKQERDTLVQSIKTTGEPLQVDASKAMSYRSDLLNTLKHGTPEERKLYIRPWIDSMALYPDEREVRIKYRVPASVLNTDVMAIPGHGISAASASLPMLGSLLLNRCRTPI